MGAGASAAVPLSANLADASEEEILSVLVALPSESRGRVTKALAAHEADENQRTYETVVVHDASGGVIAEISPMPRTVSDLKAVVQEIHGTDAKLQHLFHNTMGILDDDNQVLSGMTSFEVMLVLDDVAEFVSYAESMLATMEQSVKGVEGTADSLSRILQHANEVNKLVQNHPDLLKRSERYLVQTTYGDRLQRWGGTFTAVVQDFGKTLEEFSDNKIPGDFLKNWSWHENMQSAIKALLCHEATSAADDQQDGESCDSMIIADLTGTVICDLSPAPRTVGELNSAIQRLNMANGETLQLFHRTSGILEDVNQVLVGIKPHKILLLSGDVAELARTAEHMLAATEQATSAFHRTAADISQLMQFLPEVQKKFEEQPDLLERGRQYIRESKFDARFKEFANQNEEAFKNLDLAMKALFNDIPKANRSLEARDQDIQQPSLVRSMSSGNFSSAISGKLDDCTLSNSRGEE